MFRKAAIVLLLAASFLGAQATDLPKPVRELTFKNKTKAAKANRGARSKAKTATVCFKEDGRSIIFPEQPMDGFMVYIGASAYDCNDVDNGRFEDATPIGLVGVSCASLSTSTVNEALALCHTEMTLDTAWHKTDKRSSIVGTFWANVPELVDEILTMESPVVTGVTGAWGKITSIKNLALDYDNANEYYTLSITYKGRGWNPSA